MLIPRRKNSVLQKSGMRIYGLTGGMGSGKTEAARVFREKGIPVIDADRIGHMLIAPGGKAEEDIIRAFGEVFRHKNGGIDREKLGALVFSNREALKKLNAIVHPLISREIEQRCEALAAQRHPFVVIDAALLAEPGEGKGFLDGLIVVYCGEEERIRRLMRYRGLSREDITARLRLQTPPEVKLNQADWIVENQDSLEVFQKRILALIGELEHAGTAK